MAYGRRNRWKKGDWLVMDQESGIIDYASKMKEDWQGRYVRRRWADPEQPQDFIKPADDPKPVPFASQPTTQFEVCNVIPYFVGNTRVRTSTFSAAYHLFTPGIGEAEVGCTFIVY